MGFPYLSHLSWQRHHGHLHLLAKYRHQYLIEQQAAELQVGELSVDTGLATLEITPAALRGTSRDSTRHRCGTRPQRAYARRRRR
jgi:hypothetical protein